MLSIKKNFFKKILYDTLKKDNFIEDYMYSLTLVKLGLSLFLILLPHYNTFTINASVTSNTLGFGNNYQSELDQIQSQIHRKINEKNMHLGKAARARDEGDRLQFRDGHLIDARRSWQNADFHEQQARNLDYEIRALEERKARLLQIN